MMSNKIKLYTSVINPISNDLFFADDTELISYFNETECEVKTENCELLAIEDYETEQIDKLTHENEMLKQELEVFKRAIKLQQEFAENIIYMLNYCGGCVCDDIPDAEYFLDQARKEIEEEKKDAT